MMKFFFASALFLSTIQSGYANPYSGVELLPFNDHGWYGNGPNIARLFQKHPIRVVVEIGSWMGSSTRHLASMVPEGGMVYAVDHWLGSSEHIGGQERPYLHTLYQQFLSNVIHAKLTDKITPVRMDSVSAARALHHVVPDLIYLDGSHEYEAVYADLTAWFPFVKGHGVLCGDDWWWGTTREAIVQFAKERNLRTIVEANFWYFEEMD